MSIHESHAKTLRKFPAVARRAINVSTETLIDARELKEGVKLPLVIQPSVENVDLIGWALANREFLESKLLKHGAILFRGFNLKGAQELESFVEASSSKAIKYLERSSPRSEVSDRVYTSTDYPADQEIFPHNEHSYKKTLPMKLHFMCVKAARVGGETPLVDTREVLKQISAGLREKFEQKKWMYVRNYGEGFGLKWEEVFQTNNTAEVERYCKENQIDCEWKPGGKLRTRQIRPALATHPRTGEVVWFNHATFFHVTTLANDIRETLRKEFKDEDLPNNTFYGDGSPIEEDEAEELRAAYNAAKVEFKWRDGDIVTLDNMLTAHARNAFEGERRVLFAMSDPYTRQDF